LKWIISLWTGITEKRWALAPWAGKVLTLNYLSNAFYLCNRYFRTQFLKAQECYLPQLEVCDIAADTTNAALYVSAEIAEMLGY